MDYIEVNGTSLRYDLHGASGPILVMIHEMGGMIENWDMVAPRFAQRFRVLRYDTRGCGLSAKVGGELSVELLSDDLLALLDALGLREPVALAACALGAATAFAFAARFPERTSAVVVMSPAIDMKPEDRPSRRAMLQNVLRDGMQSIVDGAMASGYPPVLRERDPERFRAFRARWLGNDPHSFVAHYELLIDMDIAHYVEAVRCPALGIGGTLDVFRSPEYVRNVMRSIPDVEFVTIETSHHQTVETPEEIADAIDGFLKRRVLSQA
ncbi:MULTISPECIES: alpha/beta fold hydrolase [unclassified Mesorhizobium]|uniref:alpha/beta fold hydrolase n=1 Tax=unclassified Mesorhizobium TaxID=325217 RepID=UPI00112BEC50|nr:MULTISPECIES: alpha/beta hydrolase [unclassified Mesorhizobium]MBZ9699549.1 alpha/beta hydrolase [Mesorhizobium sp. CO1-1-3]MBZ9945802.1 alpha/beta hydrolase [Mesorhizobium sp. BR1-1-11]TPJ08232.1 alpha/beta fold hydrolase [Mesorhizobium sp. B2-8-1]